MQKVNRDEIVEVLNDLVRINNDRVEGYERAIEDTKDGDNDLLEVFNRMIDESRQHKSQLVDAIKTNGGTADYQETTNSGKLYRFWMKIKESISGNNKQSVLDDCEFGEDAAQKAYQEALESDAAMDDDTRELIMKQKVALKTSHDSIKSLRDMQRKISDLKKDQPARSFN